MGFLEIPMKGFAPCLERLTKLSQGQGSPSGQPSAARFQRKRWGRLRSLYHFTTASEGAGPPHNNPPASVEQAIPPSNLAKLHRRRRRLLEGLTSSLSERAAAGMRPVETTLCRQFEAVSAEAMVARWTCADAKKIIKRPHRCTICRGNSALVTKCSGTADGARGLRLGQQRRRQRFPTRSTWRIPPVVAPYPAAWQPALPTSRSAWALLSILGVQSLAGLTAIAAAYWPT